MVIRKMDKVRLPDGCFGHAIETYKSSMGFVYKIVRCDNQSIEYVDGARLTLKRKHIRNITADLIDLLTLKRRRAW